MADKSHNTTTAAIYATIAAAIAISGDFTMAALHAVLACHYWAAGRHERR
jgi:hypothetical protein